MKVCNNSGPLQQDLQNKEDKINPGNSDKLINK